MSKNNYWITFRLILLLLMAIFFSCLYFTYLRNATTHISIYKNGNIVTTAPISIDKVMEEISLLAKIPIIILRFDVWAENNVIDLYDGETSTSTNLNTNIAGEYTITPTGNKQ